MSTCNNRHQYSPRNCCYMQGLEMCSNLTEVCVYTHIYLSICLSHWCYRLFKRPQVTKTSLLFRLLVSINDVLWLEPSHLVSLCIERQACVNMQGCLTVNLLQHDWEQEVPGGHVRLLLVHHWGELIEANLPGWQRWSWAHLQQQKYKG